MPLNKITADSITDGTVVASDIADGTITLAKLQSGLLPPATANSAAAYANAAFATANTGSASGSYANSAFASANLISGVNTTQNTNITNAGTYANSAFATANTGSASGSYANSAFASANLISGVNTTQNTNITNASTYANSAFAKANTAGVGTVTSIATGNGLSGGTITSSGTLIIGCPSWLSIGSYATLWHMSTTQVGAGDTASGSVLKYNISDGNASNAGDFGASYTSNSGGTATSGTWRHMGSGLTGGACGPRYYVGLWCRVS